MQNQVNLDFIPKESQEKADIKATLILKNNDKEIIKL